MTSIPWNVFTRQPVNRIVVGEGPLESFKLSMLNAEAFWPHRETRTSLPLSEKKILSVVDGMEIVNAAKNCVGVYTKI